MNDINHKLYGTDLLGFSNAPAIASPVSQKFGVPPFSVLSARDGAWQTRKRAWIACGIKSEVGRGEKLLFESEEMTEPGLNFYRNKEKRDKASGSAKSYNTTQWLRDKNNDGEEIGGSIDTGTSIFDPVLCECIYKWFSGEGQQIIDPFAGGSVRGVVASHLGRGYWGCDLRQEQIDANAVQGEELCAAMKPKWVCGDSRERLACAPDADLVFSCPPYGDLEEYSDDPKDLSAMEFPDFLVAYRDIIKKSVLRLKQDRFACFVVGDFRDKAGMYRNFVGETINAFLDAGAKLYNEAILVTSVGSASMRVTKQFESGRKFCKTHQNILVFVKGCPKKAVESFKQTP